MRALRFLRIVHTVGRFRLDEFLPSAGLRFAFGLGYFWAGRGRPAQK